jgi:sphingomyelin phosphodiesterase
MQRWILFSLIISVYMAYDGLASHVTSPMTHPSLSHHVITPSLQRIGLSTCEECNLALEGLLIYLSTFNTTEFLDTLAIEYCIYNQIESPTVCKGTINEFAPEIITILEHQPHPTHVCEQLRLCPSNISMTPVDRVNDDTADTDDRSPVATEMSVADIRYVLQISDIHFDPFYQIGSSSICPDPLCCRSGQPPNSSFQAGPYGTVGCDTNWPLLESVFSQMHALYPSPDLILWTGDAPAHDIWNQSVSRNRNASLAIAALMEHYYPTTRLVLAIGNHENFPTDQDPGPGYNTDLIDGLIEAWGNYLTHNETREFRYAGYYSTQVNSGRNDGTRISHRPIRMISLNSDLGMSTNFWLLLSSVNASYLDLGDQLMWLNQTLSQARRNNETVWLISHASIGDMSMISPYAKQFYQIVTQYPGLIKAQFHGHTHADTFRVVSTSQGPDHIEYIVPSVTPFGGNFPSFRVYGYDPLTGIIVDYWQYFLNLTAINTTTPTPTPTPPPPRWELSYQASTEYGMPVTPTNWHRLAYQIQTNVTRLTQFCQNYYSQNGAPYCSQPAIQRDIQCQIKTFSYQEYLQCFQN